MIEIDLRGAERLLETNRRFRGALTRTIYRSLKRSLRKPTTAVRREVRGSATVRAIQKSPWGRQRDNRLTARVKRLGPTIAGNTVQAGIGIYGAPAAAGTGDRIVRHTITIRKGPSAGLVIDHPGARVLSQHGVRRDHLRQHQAGILRQLDRDVGELIERLYGL